MSAPPDVPEGTVTMLFSDLVDSTRLNQALGDDAAREIGRDVDSLARSIVADHRGVLVKEMGDGVMAAFTSARRAIAAARAMQLAVRRLPVRAGGSAIQMRVGLHTGEVITEDGDLHGETVIIAKRIEGLAPPGGILASETVHGVLGTARDELVDHGVTELKGIDAAWRVYLVPVPDDEPDPAGSPDDGLTTLAGRTTERDALVALLDDAIAGRGRMVLIGGPAGRGKSRLAREAAAEATHRGMNVLVGHCVDMESPPPYQPSIDHLEQAARRASPAGFRAALGVNAPEVAKLLPSLRQRYDDIPPSPELTPEQERRYMLHGVGEFIERAAAAQPMVLVFEDLHWADESTMLLLRHLTPRLAEVPLVVIGTYRDDEVGRDRPLASSIGPLVRDGGAVDLHLSLLDRSEVAAMLTSTAGRTPPDELVELVLSETQGNPFFVEELFRFLRDNGRLFDADGGWRSGIEIGETEVPQGVRLLIERRLDQLDAGHRRALAAAAVIGRSFSFGHLVAVTGIDEDALLDAVEAGERAGLIVEEAGDEARSSFVHEQIRQTLVGELSLARRQRFHLRVADALEADRSARLVDVAHHLFSAGTAAPTNRVVTALERAARANIDALAFEDALPHLERALRIADSDDGGDRDDRHGGLLRLQATALRGSGRVDAALDVLARAMTTSHDPRELATIRLERVRLLNDQYRAAEGLDDLDLLASADEVIGDPTLRVTMLLARGRAHYILSLDDPAHAQLARDAYEAAYEAASAVDDAESMARALLASTWFTDYWADYGPIADANLREASQLAARIGDDDLALDADAGLMHRSGMSGFDRTASEELLARLEHRRDPVKLNAHCFWMMWQYQYLGDFAASVAMCDRGLALADLIGSAPVQYGSIKAISLVELGRFDEVDAAIAQEITDDDHPFGQAMASLARSVFLTRVAAWDAAARSLDDTLRRAAELSRVWMLSWATSLRGTVAAHRRVLGDDDGWVAGDVRPGSLARAEIALVEGRLDEALALATSVADRQDVTVRSDLARSLDLVARARLELGAVDAAGAAASRGAAVADEMGFDAIGWRLHRVCSLATGAVDDPGAELFHRLSARIGDPELRAAFERQAFAPTMS